MYAALNEMPRASVRVFRVFKRHIRRAGRFADVFWCSLRKTYRWLVDFARCETGALVGWVLILDVYHTTIWDI